MRNPLDAWREKRRYHHAYRQLSRLNDQLLSDVGLTRDDLETLRKGHAPWLDASGTR
jgi:uncharacterized protein YjiS (DUF1127 family)